MPLLADVPFEPLLSAPRLSDVVEALNLGIEQAGNLPHARVQHLVTAGRGVEGVIDRLLPGSLVVAAGERSDIVLATALAYMQGMPLAGLLLTCGTRLSPQSRPCCARPCSWLPILTTAQDTFATVVRWPGCRAMCAATTPSASQAIAHTAAHRHRRAARSHRPPAAAHAAGGVSPRWCRRRAPPPGASCCPRATSRAPCRPRRSARARASRPACCSASPPGSARWPERRAWFCRPDRDPRSGRGRGATRCRWSSAPRQGAHAGAGRAAA